MMPFNDVQELYPDLPLQTLSDTWNSHDTEVTHACGSGNNKLDRPGSLRKSSALFLHAHPTVKLEGSRALGSRCSCT